MEFLASLYCARVGGSSTRRCPLAEQATARLKLHVKEGSGEFQLNLH